MKDLSIIIVNYNVKHFLEQTLTSVYKALNGINAEVFVVDNNSVDGSCAVVKQKFPKAVLIENKENVGFSKANNQAIKLAEGKYVLLLNPDTVVEEDTFQKCLKFMDTHTDAGGLGVKMVDGSGVFLAESKRGLPTPWAAFYKMFGLSKLFPKSKKFGKYHLTYLNKEDTHEIEVLSGAFMFMRKTALDKAGLLDEDYFMYGEDIDLSYRLTQAGFKNYYHPDTTIIHYKGESTKKSSVNYVFVFYKAMVIFAKKHYSSSNAWLFSLIINFAIYLRAGMALSTRFIKRMAWPMFDVASIYTGMYFLKSYWEVNHKWVKTDYPPEYMLIAVPTYILFWLVPTYFSGGYDHPFKASKVVRGVLIGAVLISAISNFIDAYRFSKALIVLGSTYTIFSIVFSRVIAHFIRHRNFNLGQDVNKRIALVGNKTEIDRIESILKEHSPEVEIIGSIYMKPENLNANKSLGSVEDIGVLANLYKLDELIFCAKDIPAQKIIHLMTTINRKDIDYKIVPDDSNFIIGSSSKNAQGDYYSFDLELNINKKENRRKKRLMDIGLSFLIIGFFPVLIFTKGKFKNLINAFKVLGGKKTWVGFSEDVSVTLPNLKQGVFSPTTAEKVEDQKTIDRLNLLYAKDQSTHLDLEFIIANL